MSKRPIIVWFRQDLRLADNVALSKAAQSGAPIIALYVLDNESSGHWAPGAASQWWLHHSLTELASRLADFGIKLVLRRGAAAAVVRSLAREVGAAGVYFSRQYEPWASSVEAVILTEHIRGEGELDVRRFPGALLHDPSESRTKDGMPFKG